MTKTIHDSPIPDECKKEARALCDKWKGRITLVVAAYNHHDDGSRPTLWPTTNNEEIASQIVCQLHDILHPPTDFPPHAAGHN